jgi:hypothetical protein
MELALVSKVSLGQIAPLSLVLTAAAVKAFAFMENVSAFRDGRVWIVLLVNVMMVAIITVSASPVVAVFA